MILLVLGFGLVLLISVLLVLVRRTSSAPDEEIEAMIAMDIAADGELDGRLEPD